MVRRVPGESHDAGKVLTAALLRCTGIWAKDVDVINTLSRGLRAGTVWVNTYNQYDAGMPFGGAPPLLVPPLLFPLHIIHHRLLCHLFYMLYCIQHPSPLSYSNFQRIADTILLVPWVIIPCRGSETCCLMMTRSTLQLNAAAQKQLRAHLSAQPPRAALPAGGTTPAGYKNSGIGRDKGEESLENFTQVC